ncbi:CynX/NimT family MFS transporter [Pseudomonas sp. Pseusp122]|uniref:MFS transporter n=1 Tax=unclassified Pseudomonas TaxID=196821 RepID=UPI0039A69065
MQSICTALPAEPHRAPGLAITQRSHFPAPGNQADFAENPQALSIALAILCIVLVALTLRPAIVSIGPLLPGMQQAFALSHTQASLLTAIPTLLMGLLALPTPWLARRFGRDRVILVALAVLCIATALRAFADSIGLLFLSTAGVGAGIAVAGALIAGFVKASYPEQAALLMGVYATALALGSTVAAALTGPLTIEAASWRISAGFWALPVVIAFMAWLYIERQGRSHERSKAAGAAQPMPLRNPTAWLIALFFACNNMIFYAYISWIAPMYVDFGRTPTSAGLILASFTLAFMIANPVFGLLSRNEDRRIALAVSSGIAFVGILATAIAPQAVPFVMVPVIAFGTGGAFTLGMTLPLDNARSSAEANAWNAMVLLFAYVVAAAGPLLMGYLRDATGSFQPSLWLMAGVSLTMVILTPFLKPYLHK